MLVGSSFRLFSTYGKQEPLSSCRGQASLCGGLSCCGTWGLGCTGFGSMAHGFSCSAACGIFPDQGMKLCLLHWKIDSSPLSHQGNPLHVFDHVR